MKQQVLHIIAQAHLDPVWLWPWRDGCAAALTTMQSALQLMQEIPDLCFSWSAASTYRWAQEMDPCLAATIRQRIQEGRWEVVGGWIVEPDCNIPSTESFVRQCLYGQRYLAAAFGAHVDVGYNVDSFGHSGGLPQILARAGYRYYVMMRPQPQESDLPLPLLFWWQSPDGSRVLTWRIPYGYGQGPTTPATLLEEQLREGWPDYFAPGFQHGAFFLGVGDHGGGPTRQQIQKIRELQPDDSLPELRFSTLQRFFTAIEDSAAFPDLPVVRGELQHHARGCYAAHGQIKALNRRAEQSLCKAETLSVLAGLVGQRDYPTDRLRQAWWQLLFHQFHDILAGTCVPSAYQTAGDSLGAACEAADTAAIDALHFLARRVDTSGGPAGVLFALNPLPWARPCLVQVDTFVASHGEYRITHLQTPDGVRVPIQWLPAEAGFGPYGAEWARLIAVVELPACGYRVFHLVSRRDGAQGRMTTAACRTGCQPVLQSAFFRLAHGEAPPVEEEARRITTPPDRFGLSSLKTATGRELLAAPLGLVVVDDPSDTWGHGVGEFRQELGRPALEATEIIADGPIVRLVRQRGRWHSSTILLDLATYQHVDAVELRLRVNWQEPRQMLKLEIPTVLAQVRTFAQVPGGVVERHANGGEEPAQDWVALEGTIGSVTCALGLANAATYSCDCLGGLLRATYLRCVPYAEHDPLKLPPDFPGPFLDQGWQERRFWLVGAEGPYTALGLPRRAQEFQTPAEYVLDAAHPGSEPWAQSFLAVSPANVVVLAIKPAEDGGGLIVRLQEMHGQEARAELAIPRLGLTWSETIHPWQIRSLKVETDGHIRLREVGLLEQPVTTGD